MATSRLSSWSVRVAALTIVALFGTGWGTMASGATFTKVSVSVTVNGQPAATSSDARPAQLDPSRQANVRIRVTNEGPNAVRVSTVRFEGNVLDLPLFSYDTAVDLTVPPGQTKSLTFPVVLTGLGSQATGLVSATVTLLDPSGAPLAAQSLVTNVHGSIASIYGLFGLVVLVLTISSLGLALLALARHTLPENRWVRAVRFFIPGFGVGLVLTFTMSAFRVFVPTAGHWLPLLIVPSLAGLALGFLTPAPNEEEYDDYDDDVLLAQIIVVDDDPLDEVASNGHQPVPATPTPVARPSASAAPDSRPTAAPDSRPTAAPDSRPTIEP
jgi:hypothetical protein